MAGVMRSGGDSSVRRHQGGIEVAGGVDVCWFGTHVVIEIKEDSSAALHFSIDEELDA